MSDTERDTPRVSSNCSADEAAPYDAPPDSSYRTQRLTLIDAAPILEHAGKSYAREECPWCGEMR